MGALVAGLLALAALLVPLAASPAVAGGWAGGVDLYRPGVYSMQQTWWWCAAADVQIMRNIVFHQRDHSASAQATYYAYMHAHDRYVMPIDQGVDAQGWAAGLKRYLSAGYRLVAAATFDTAVRSAVVALRRTGMPVGLIVDHGRHAWVMTGFTATADPAATSAFTVTSVRIVGPLYGRQSLNGYDPPPDTRLSVAALRTFLTAYANRYWRTIWDGRFVTMQPSVTARQVTPAATPHSAAMPSPSPLPTPTAAPTASPQPTVAAPSVTPVAGSAALGRPPTNVDAPRPAAADTSEPPLTAMLAAALALALAGLAGRRVLERRRDRRRGASRP